MSRLVFYSNEYGSGEIRARQIASYLNMPCDANRLCEDDVVIGVKRYLTDENIKFIKKMYVDVVDWYGLVPQLKGRNDIGVIAIGKLAKRYLSKELGRDDIVLIPEHHCNFERTVLKVSQPKTVGFIGYPESFHLNTQVVKQNLKNIGLNFKYCVDFENREDVRNFYRQIDIQLTFRAHDDMTELKNPLKVINAGSFGIPSVCYPEPSYVEEGVMFAKADNLEEAIQRCADLVRLPEYYRHMSNIAIKQSEQYHISNIADKYMELLL